jgi:uncharacterized protein YbaP (TraB family)
VRTPLLAALAALLLAQPAQAAPAMWTVKDADSTVILFGSFHLLPPGLDWRSERLDRALSDADDLWFEIPPDDAVNPAAAQDVLAKASLPPGQSLSALLSKAGTKRLARAAEKIGVPLATLDRLRPWYAETVIGLALYRMQGALPEEGVERQIDHLTPANVRRVALETAAQQIDTLAGATQEEQVASLEQSLRQFEKDPDQFRRLVAMWLAGDVSGLRREAVDELRREAPHQYRALLVDRNQAWLPKIVERLDGSGRTVIVVGVGHLVGPAGLPALLRAKGFKVEGP